MSPRRASPDRAVPACNGNPVAAPSTRPFPLAMLPVGHVGPEPGCRVPQFVALVVDGISMMRCPSGSVPAPSMGTYSQPSSRVAGTSVASTTFHATFHWQLREVCRTAAISSSVESPQTTASGPSLIRPTATRCALRRCGRRQPAALCSQPAGPRAPHSPAPSGAIRQVSSSRRRTRRLPSDRDDHWHRGMCPGMPSGGANRSGPALS